MNSPHRTRLISLELNTGKLRKQCNYIGLFVVFLTLCTPFYWGNLSVYSESYFRYGPHTPHASNTAWVVPFSYVGWGTSAVLAVRVVGFIGEIWTMILSCVLLDTGMLLSFFSVQYSSTCLNLSLGLSSGLGMGLMLNTGLQRVMSSELRYAGVVISIITSARYLGGTVLNQAITWYINPANLSPDLSKGRQKYFTQPDVLDKVPSVFLVFGVVSLCCHTIGMFLIIPYVKRKSHGMEDALAPKTTLELTESKVRENQDVANERRDSSYSAELPGNVEASYTSNISPTDMLKTKAFCVLFLVSSLSSFSDTVLFTFYKAYGQIWISDDQFLAFFGSVFLVMSVPTRPIVGGFIDVYGVKYSILLLTCLSCIVSSFWYFTSMLSKWFYVVWTLVYHCINSGVNVLLPVAVLKVFGCEHFSMNYGIVVFSTVLICLTAPTMTQWLLDTCGWFYLFICVGFISAFVTFATVIWFPEK